MSIARTSNLICQARAGMFGQVKSYVKDTRPADVRVYP